MIFSTSRIITVEQETVPIVTRIRTKIPADSPTFYPVDSPEKIADVDQGNQS